tara:strand:+ start:453 stop:662 length:210 start_codon:yes stop_codon:yes gene_type:complete
MNTKQTKFADDFLDMVRTTAEKNDISMVEARVSAQRMIHVAHANTTCSFSKEEWGEIREYVTDCSSKWA